MLAIGIREGSHEPELIEVDTPEAGEGQVLVEALRVGICGTDREIIEAGAPGRVPEGAEFLILGHEALGRVAAVGKGVEGVAEGQLVAPTVRRAKSGDHACRVDLLDADEYTERGIMRQHGFAQEFWVERPEYLNKVPEAIADVAVLTEPFSVVEKAINEAMLLQKARLEHACPQPAEQRALVLGPGPIGFAAAFVCLAHGFDVTIGGRDAAGSEKAKFVESLGCTYVNTEETDFAAIGDTDDGWDLMVEAAGAGPLVFEALKALKNRGFMSLTGIGPIGKEASIDANRFLTEAVMRNQLILGSVNAAKRDFEDAVEHLVWAHERFPEQVKGLITGSYPVRDMKEAYADVIDKKRKPGGIKTVIEF